MNISSMKLIDVHAHAHFNAYKNDMDEVITRSLEKGVGMILIGTQKDTSKSGVEVAQRYDNVWSSVALHPNHLFPVYIDEGEVPFETREEDFDYEYYKALAQQPGVVAIGECGLDWYRIPEDKDLEEVKAKQHEVFRQHLDLCEELNLPVIIHCRDAHKETADVLEEYVNAGKLARRGLIHCYTGNWEEAQRYIALGFYISFTGIITFPPRKGEGEVSPLQEVVQKVPLEWMTIETDAPYLTPLPYRGKRNEPWYVEFIAQKVAELKGLSVEEVEKTTLENSKKLFGI